MQNDKEMYSSLQKHINFHLNTSNLKEIILINATANNSQNESYSVCILISKSTNLTDIFVIYYTLFILY